MPLRLPPPYTEIALREGGDAFARAIGDAQLGAGAGTLVWVRRYDSADCAVVLEPEESLAIARHVVLAGMAAVSAALLAISPPDKPLSLDWPDAIRFDGGLVGGGRLAWPENCGEAEIPDWLVFGFSLRVHVDQHLEPPPPALVQEGFDDFETGPFVESFARHLMLMLDQWAQGGAPAARAMWRQYGGGPERGGPEGGGPKSSDLAVSLRAPSWLRYGEIAQ